MPHSISPMQRSPHNKCHLKSKEMSGLIVFILSFCRSFHRQSPSFVGMCIHMSTTIICHPLETHLNSTQHSTASLGTVNQSTQAVMLALSLIETPFKSCFICRYRLLESLFFRNHPQTPWRWADVCLLPVRVYTFSHKNTQNEASLFRFECFIIPSAI